MNLAERNAEMIAAYRAGAKQVELAKRYGLSQGRVSRILIGSGVVNRVGRPRVAPAEPKAREHYIKVRAILGAEAARRELGL